MAARSEEVIAIAKRWLLLVLFAALSASAQTVSPSPMGTWRTFDDRTGKERSLVRIEETGGVLTGRIVAAIDPVDGARTCTGCDDDRKGKPMIGLEIIRGMRQQGDVWTGGRVLDPQTGSVYRGTMHLEEGGRKLVLRGYVVIPLFGRSQTWLRAAP
jgi:uncharacterized protein (DUF2147 family)